MLTGLFSLAALGLAGAAPPAGMDGPPPPEAMIDFLGRRGLCRRLDEEDPAYSPELRRSLERERDRLACAGLPEEERAWRRLYRSDPNAVAWLDLDPLKFELPQVVVHSYDGPPPALPLRVEHRGIDASGRNPYAVAVERDASGSAPVRFRISYAGRPERRFSLPGERLPRLDLYSLWTALKAEPPDEGLRVEMRFGWPRGYCSAGEGEDDRPTLTVTLDGEGKLSAEAEEANNCVSAWVPLPVTELEGARSDPHP